MCNDKFVHLHVHTEYSLLDGLSQINRLVKRAQQLEMPSLAITDHGTMFGVIDFYRACKKAEIKPLIGMESYLARRGMEDRDPRLDRKPYHMLLLAKNQTGYRNLLKLASEAQLRGYYYQPRIDRELLAAHSEGLIATTGCLGAQVPNAIMDGRDDEARELIGWYQEVFGQENFFLELQYHDIDVLENVNNWLAEYRKSGHTPVQFVATNDVHYVLEEDHDPHDTLLCIQTGNLKTDTNRLRMSDASYHLTSHEEMDAIFLQKYPWLDEALRTEAIINTAKVADMCDVNLDTEGYHLPLFPVPGDHTPVSYLRYLCEKGIEWRFGERQHEQVLQDRLNHELNIIHTMGFDTYFLIVWDLCEFARQADIWWNVRGSGAGSLVAYCLGITNIDPMLNSLIFERFLNPARGTMPDIDLDYPDDRRAEMIEYTARKYGSDKVAAIITFGTMGAKAAIRDVGRALDVPLSTVNDAVRLIPTEAKQKPIEVYVESNPDLLNIYRKDEEMRQVIDTAKKLQGVARHASTHAAGVIVADKPLVEYIPLHRLTRGDDEASTLQQVTQFPMETCESIGLLKVDFLGLSTLTFLRRASDLIHKNRGTRWTMDNIPYRPHAGDDLEDWQIKENDMLARTFEMFGRGETVGVFQVESTGMQQMLRGMRPKKFEHIIAGISLYRPGPMDFIPRYNARMHGEEAIPYHHPKLESILAETYGVITYQEQILQIAGELFSYPLAEADLMRRAVSKKKEKELIKHKALFIERGPQNGIDAQTSEEIFKEIEFFANYGFNKSHAADYAVITVQTGFLKCNYPAEYMAALLSVYREDSTKVSTFLEECGRLNIDVLPPSVNHSAFDFDIQTREDGTQGIRFGMAAVKNVSVNGARAIIEARDDGGVFADLEDFCKRVDLRQVGKRTLESLVKTGALSDFGTRPQLLLALDRMVRFSGDHHNEKEAGQANMFGEMGGMSDELLKNLPNEPEASQREMLDWEKELLGFYVTSHPIDAVLKIVDPGNLTRTIALRDELDTPQDRPVAMVGLVSGVREIFTRKEEQMAVIQLEDRYGTVEVVLFPRTWLKFKDMVREREHGVVFIQGKVDRKRGDAQIICDAVMTEYEDFKADRGTNGGYNGGGSYRPPQHEFAPPPLDHAPMEEPPPRDFSSADDFAPPTSSQTPEPVVSELGIDWETELANYGQAADHDDASAKIVDVWFERTGDDDRDLRRLDRVCEILASYPGNDRFVVTVLSDEGNYLLEFPDGTTQYCQELVEELSRFIAVEHVRVLSSENPF